MKVELVELLLAYMTFDLVTLLAWETVSEHSLPAYPGRHRQVNPFWWSSQVPSCWHGSSTQSSMSTSHRRPAIRRVTVIILTLCVQTCRYRLQSWHMQRWSLGIQTNYFCFSQIELVYNYYSDIATFKWPLALCCLISWLSDWLNDWYSHNKTREKNKKQSVTPNTLW